MSTARILVLGGSGFVGRHAVARLVAAGWSVVVPTRYRERAKHLILLPTADVVEADIHDPLALEQLAAGANAAINLVGILNETRRGDFERAHVELPRKLIAACRAMRVPRLLHMSALNAGGKAPSRYLRSKGEGEALVADSGLAWTIFQPSVIFGREDSFLNLFARLERFLPVIALARADARFQPVYVGDVANAFVRAVDDDYTHRRRYPLCGPEVYTLRELVAYVGELTGYDRPIVPLGPALSTLQARVLEMLPGKLMSRDNLASMELDSVCDCDFPAIFGSNPTALEAVAPDYLTPAASRSRYSGLRAQGGR
ncbi:MAG: complex I NDUFA9 subunit family protein [Pseudomonadota bacterium]|nr:complex I NDUFA9 subunit family protein [Pseudomonadota bacterium]